MASDDDKSRSRSRSADSRRKSRKMSDGDRSKSRSRSRSRSPARENQERVTKVIDIATDDAAFVLGRGGATKRKIARVSGANIELDEHALTITLNGTEKQCNHAIDYIDFIKQQRVGPVTIDMERSRGDFTGYTVPGDCIGFVMGRNGQTLRSMEEEWGVLMFFAKTEGSQRGTVNGVYAPSRRPHAIGATRLRQGRRWMVFFYILGPFRRCRSTQATTNNCASSGRWRRGEVPS